MLRLSYRWNRASPGKDSWRDLGFYLGENLWRTVHSTGNCASSYNKHNTWLPFLSSLWVPFWYPALGFPFWVPFGYPTSTVWVLMNTSKYIFLYDSYNKHNAWVLFWGSFGFPSGTLHLDSLFEFPLGTLQVPFGFSWIPLSIQSYMIAIISIMHGFPFWGPFEFSSGTLRIPFGFPLGAL